MPRRKSNIGRKTRSSRNQEAYRDKLTPEQRSQRQTADRVRMYVARTLEKPEKREARLEAMRVYSQRRISNTKRLALRKANRDRMREVRRFLLLHRIESDTVAENASSTRSTRTRINSAACIRNEEEVSAYDVCSSESNDESNDALSHELINDSCSGVSVVSIDENSVIILDDASNSSMDAASVVSINDSITEVSIETIYDSSGESIIETRSESNEYIEECISENEASDGSDGMKSDDSQSGDDALFNPSGPLTAFQCSAADVDGENVLISNSVRRIQNFMRVTVSVDIPLKNSISE